MKNWSPMRKILAAVLVLALAGWALDALLGGGTPRAAQAASATSSPQSAPSSEEADVAQLVEHLLSDEYTPVSGELEHLERDLFVPTPLMQAATLPESEPEEEPEPADQPRPAADFPSRHVLTGVIIGQTPLAQVDGRLLPLGAVLDGCKLVEIERDLVIFECADSRERVKLELKQPSAEPGQTP